MDKEFARRMNALTTEFYKCVASSFSATRQSGWTGWRRVLEYAQVDEQTHPQQPLRVLDVGCGNLRFEHFLREHGIRPQAWAWDNCDALVTADDSDVHYEHVDLAEMLLHDTACAMGDSLLPVTPPCDLAVSFGFMHHLPFFEQRVALLEALIAHTRPGGHVCVTFWRFADDKRLQAKAQRVEGATENDYLLGWQDRADVARFCHHTPESEVDALVASVAHIAAEVERFSADGKSGKLNRYVVLRVR